MGKIADILVEGGHEVVLYQPKFNDEYNVSGTKLARVIQRKRDFEVSLDFLNLEKDAWRDSMGGVSDNNDKLMETITKMFTSMRNSCERQLSDHDLMERLKSEKFDLAIGESMDVCFYGIVRRAGIPKYISAFSTNLYVGAASILGLPALPSFIPGFIEVQPNMTYWNRARNLVTNVLLYYTGKSIFVDPIEKVVKAHLGEDFDTAEAIALSSYFFVNSEEHVAYPRPITHKIIDVGGMGMPKAAQLEAKFERILQSSREGVVLVSFGSLSKSIFMPDTAKKAFVEAFAQFPNVTFLWKYERPEDKIAEGHSNIVLVDWIPQIELLGHPRLLAFITHAGMNSISEAVYKGVPLICIPLLGDQHRNALMVESRNLAVVVDKSQVNARTLEAAVRRVLYDDRRIAENARETSHMIAKKPLSPDERVLKYTEFAAEFDVAENLDMYGRRLSFIQFYSMDATMSLLRLALVPLVVCVLIGELYAAAPTGGKPKKPCKPKNPATPASGHPIVDAHNKYRESLANGREKNQAGETMPKAKNMYKLKWDTALEQKAQAWADKCVFQHSQGRGDVGENLFQGTSSSNEDAFKQAAAAWWEELTTKGANAQDTKYTVEEFNRGNGHWSQMAWAKSVKIGCGAKDCGNPIPGTMVVCNYQVAGNLLDTPVYEKGEPCKADAECTTVSGSKCDTKSGLCEAP